MQMKKAAHRRPFWTLESDDLSAAVRWDVLLRITGASGAYPCNGALIRDGWRERDGNGLRLCVHGHQDNAGRRSTCN